MVLVQGFISTLLFARRVEPLLCYEISTCLTCTSPLSEKEKGLISFIFSKDQNLKLIKPCRLLLIVKGVASRRGILLKKKQKKATKGILYLQDVQILSHWWSGPGKMPAAGGLLPIWTCIAINKKWMHYNSNHLCLPDWVITACWLGSLTVKTVPDRLCFHLIELQLGPHFISPEAVFWELLLCRKCMETEIYVYNQAGW